MEEALEHLNQHSYTTEKCDSAGSDSLQNSRPDKKNPFCETVKDAETNSILCKTTNIENLTSVTVGVMGNDEGELFGEKPLRVEDSLQDTSKDSDGLSGDANPYKQQEEDKVDTEEINDKEDLPRDRNLNLDISASPNDISQETCSETHKLTSEEKNVETDDVGLKIPLVHSSSIAESGIVFSEKDHDGLTSRQRHGPDEECNKMEMENVTDEEAATDKFTTEEEVIVAKYVNEGMNTEMGENIGTEVAEEKNKDEDILIHEYKNQQISDLREGKCSTSSIVHIDAVSPESTDGVEIVEERIEDNATKKIGNDVSSKEAAPQYREIFSEKLEKGNSISNEKYFKLANSQDDPETGPTGISTVKVEVASEENIMSETGKDQLEVTTAKLAEYALDEQNLCTASVAEDPTTQIFQTGDSVNAHTVENSDQMLHEHNHETATERQIVEKDDNSSEMPMPENSENFVANKDIKLEKLSDEVDKEKHEKITDNMPDKPCFQEIENTTESEELESAENRSYVGDKISTSENTGRNVIDEQETYSRDEKRDSIVKEVGSDNVIFTYHSVAQLKEKVHPINEEESKKLDEISDVMYDDALSREKVPDNADANRQILKHDTLDITEDPVREGLMENEKSTENLGSVSEDTYTETIANIGATNNGSGNEGDDDLSIVEASGLGKEPGAPDVKISMETEELRGNSNPEKESTDMVLNVKERSQEDEKTSEVEKLNGKKSTREDEKLDIASEPVFEDQAGETNSKATTNIQDLIDENHLEEEQNIKKVDQYDEPETAKSKDEDNKEMYVSDDSDSYELAKGKMDDKGGKQHEEKAKSGCEEKTYQTMNVENNEVNIQEEKTDMEKPSVSENENEETSGESVGKNIHYSIDDDNPEKEIITVNQNDEAETEKLKDDDIKEMNVGDFSDSHELAETITHERVGKWHEETANSGYEEEINQVEYIDETNTQEEKTHIVKLEINSEPISEDQIEEINSELVATNTHDLIDDGNQEKKQNIEIVNLNDEPVAAKLKDEDNKEIYVGDISGSYELAERTIYDKIGKRHVEKMNSGGEEEICQAVNVKNNEVDTQKEKIDSEKVGITSETVSGDQIKESQETSQETVATNIHNSVDDDNPEKEKRIKNVNLNDEPETARLTDEKNKEMYDSNVSDSFELAEGTTHNKVGKWHEETSNSRCEEETCQMVDVENNNEVDVQEEKRDSEKLGITSKMVSNDQFERSQETSQESVAADIHDSADDANSEKEQNIEMVNLNDEPETAKLKDEDNKEIYVGDISGSYELAEGTIHDKVGKRHEEKTNSGGEEETCQAVNVENNKVDIQKEKIDSEKVGITSETVSGDQIEESQETVATNIHNLIDDDNPEKENIKMVTLNDDPETAKLKDEDNKEIYVSDVSDSYELAEGTTRNKVGKWHEETSNSGCEEETYQMENVENNEVDIQEEKRDTEKLETTSETISEDQIEGRHEISQESVAPNIHDSINDDNPEKEQNIRRVDLNDEPETAMLTDEDNKEMYVGDASYSLESAEEATHNKIGKRHEETSNSGCEEETCQKVNVENNEVDIQEEKTDSEKLGITPETVSDDKIEESQETSQESVAADIHDSVDDDSSEKENIKIVIRNDEPETAKLKDEDNKEMNVGDVSDSYELAEGTTHKKVSKWHEEPSNSGCGKETCQFVNAENNSEVDIQEEKVYSEKLEIASEMVSEDQTEESQETGQESVATNTGDLIDDDSSEKQITMVNQNDESETAKLKNDDNKEMNVGDISDSHELAERTTQERTGKRHEEITNSGCEEETHQMLNVEDNEIDIKEEKREMGKLGTDSESISGEQIEEINSELEATNIHGLIDDDNQQLKIFKTVDEELETAKLKDEHNNKLIIGDTWHEETSNSRCEADVHQTMNREDNYNLDIRDEKADNEKLEITSESISENKIEETNRESVATNIGDVIYKTNQEAEIIRLVNLNDKPENAKLKDEDIKEMSIGDISDSLELAVEITIHDRVGNLNEETTNSRYQEETHQMKDAKEINEVDNQEEMTNTEKYEITSETVSEEQIEETNIEPVVTNFHDLIADDDNPEKEIVEVANLNVEPETVKLKDDNNKQMNVSDISDSCELSQKTIYHRVGEQQEEPTYSGCEEETYEVINAEDKNEVDNLEDKMDAEKFAIATESESKEKNSESVTTTIHDSVEDEKAENKQTVEMVGLNDNPGTEKVKDDDNEKRNNGDISNTPKSFDGTKHDRVDKQHEETTYTAGEEDIKQSSDSNNATEVTVDEDGAGTKKLELISDTMSENQEQYATYEAKNAQMESTVGDCTSSGTTGILPISDMKYEDKVQEAGPVPNLSSSEVRKSIVHQISGNKRTYETLVSSLKEDVVEKAYKLDSQEKSKVFSMDERRDENLSKKEQIPETIIKNPSNNVSGRLEESAEIFGQRQITEDGAIMDDDSVSVRCEPVKETCPDKEEYQMIEEEIPESTYRDQGDESDEKDDKKSRTTHDKGKNSGSITIPQNPESLAEIEPVNINLSENDENRTMKADPHEDQSYNASNICTEDGSLSHLNEERENVNVDDEESRNKMFDDLPVGTILTDKAGLQSDQRESTSKSEDMKDMILNEEILEARTETEAEKNMIPEETYKIADTETLKTNDEESISKNVENSPVMPTPVGETSEEIEESYDKALHDPQEKQIHQGISEIDSNTTGSGVIEEDISEGTLSVPVEGETTKHFSAGGNDCSHQEREGSKSTQVKLLEEAKAIDEAGFVPSKQALDTEVDKLNDECGLVCKENLKSNESEKNQEEEETVKEKEMDVCLDTSSNMASKKPVVAVQVESPCEQIEAATEAVKGIDKVAAESISISQENFEIKAGESSIEGGDKKNCDPVEDFHSTKESSPEKKLQNNTFEDKFEGLNHGVSKEQPDISEDNTNKEQDSWESSETKELEDETQDEGNEIREEKEVSRTINMGESNQNESSEERKNLEKSKLEDVEIKNTFSIVQEGVQTESGNCNRERLDKEDTDVNSEKIFHEDENNDEEATVAMESAASDTAEGATSDELELKSMTAREKAEDMDATNEKTEKMVDDFPNTDSMVELVTNVEASGSHSQMHKIELPTLESTKERFQSMGTRGEGEDERSEELNTKLQEDSKELIEHEHQSAIVLEGVQRTGPSEKIEEKITIEQDISEEPRAWLKEETENEPLQKDEIETQKKKELQTDCETETTDILATDSSKEEGKEYDDAQSQNFPRTILTYEEEIASPVTKLEEKKNIDATLDAYIENETVHEQFQKDHIEAENDKPQDEQELETTCIMAHESPYDEVKEFACKPSGHNSMSNLNFKIEPELSVNLEDENKNLEATPGACINSETSHKRLQKDEVSIVKKEPQTMEDKSPNNNVMECDCILSEQNPVMTVLTEETEITLPKDVQGEKKCSDATMNACMKDEQLQKDGIEAEKNNEPETRWELQTTDARANKSANNGATEFDSSPSENTFMTIFTEKIRGALLLTGENEKKNLDVTPSYCVKDETNQEQFQKNNTDSDKYEEPYDKWKMETTHVTKNESPNDEVKELDSISSEQDSLSAVLTKKIKTALSMGRMDEKKNTEADPGTFMKVETTNEQLEKDETNVKNMKEPQANESPNYEVNKLDCIPLDENSVKILSTDHLETALLIDEGNEKKNRDALSLTGSTAEGIVHEVAQKNVVSNYMLSKHTEDKATVEELAKKACIEDLIGVHKLDYSSIDSGSLDEAIDAENITVHLSARGEEVPERATDTVQISEDSRIETLNKEDREKIGKASRLVSKMEVDETNCSSVTLTEDEVKNHKSSTEQTTEARSPVKRECMKHTEEESIEVLEFDNSQNEEKRQDSDDLPVSRLLLEHILRNNSDMQDQTYDAVAEERGQEYNDNISDHATTEKQGVSLSAELEETQKKLEDPSILSQKERIHDEEENTANAAIKEEETPQSIMKYASPSLSKSEDITDNEHISKYEDITASLPTKIVTEETRISEDRSDAEKLENASDLKIDEVNQDKKNMGISEVTDDKEQNNIQNSSINTVVDGVKDEISGLLYEASAHDVKIRNGSMKMTSDDPSGPNNNSQVNSVKTMTGNPENLNKDVEASFITESSEDNILQDEGDEDGKVISKDLDKFKNISHTKTEEKTRSHSETVRYTESILQSEETVPSSQYNQTVNSSESSISEIHNHEQKEEAASEIKSEDKNEEFGKESHHEIAEIVQNVNNDSPEGPQIPDSPQVQELKLILESANEPVQIATRSMEERSIEISNDEKQKKAAPDTQIEEDNTDEEKEEDEHKIEGAKQDVKVNVEARDANSKKAHKKSHNILSGVGSKVKHSLAKVKKAITGKSSQPKATSPK